MRSIFDTYSGKNDASKRTFDCPGDRTVMQVSPVCRGITNGRIGPKLGLNHRFYKIMQHPKFRPDPSIQSHPILATSSEGTPLPPRSISIVSRSILIRFTRSLRIQKRDANPNRSIYNTSRKATDWQNHFRNSWPLRALRLIFAILSQSEWSVFNSEGGFALPYHHGCYLLSLPPFLPPIPIRS